MTKVFLLNYILPELIDYFKQKEQPDYRAQQLLAWVYQHNVFEFQAMTNLPAELRQQLEQEMVILTGREIIRRESQDGTIKILIEFETDSAPTPRQVETVLIPDDKRHTACLSTQFGCPLKCAFCATGQGPFQGNLQAGQIVEQALRFQKYLKMKGQRLSHVVFMGMGEPFLNYEATLKAARILNASWGLRISARRITISTSGLPEVIRRLADEALPFNLAISLHSPWQEKREKIMPLAAKYPLTSILEAAVYYFGKTGREVTLEYLMIPGFNLSWNDARKLASLARKIRANVNLIPYNPVDPSSFRSPRPAEIIKFVNWLRQLGINTHVRRSRGKDIEAACGQLRQKRLDKPKD